MVCWFGYDWAQATAKVREITVELKINAENTLLYVRGRGVKTGARGKMNRDGGVSGLRANATSRRFPILSDEALIVKTLARSFPCQGSTVIVTFSQRRWNGQ